MTTRFARQSLATAVTVLCVALHLSGSLHYLLVEHARCMLHGELSHASPGHDPAVTTARDAWTGAARIGSKAGEEPGHDHCLVAGCQRIAASATRCNAGPAHVATTTRAVAICAARVPIATLFAAPKTSPPA